ncbi:MAG TPA: hypothetical protein VMW32_00350 [Bacteroidales bacterium]|nr:hypothetical protein [Bacteroidales bacterium]
MKRKIIVLAIFAAFTLAQVAAQTANRERLDAFKIAFFTKRLNLSSQEAEKFWPVYNEYQNMRIKIQLERQQLNRAFNQNVANLSDRDITELGDKLIGLEVKEAELAVEFHKRVKTILPPAKVLRLYQAENQYRAQLLNELQERREVRNNQNIRQQ